VNGLAGYLLYRVLAGIFGLFPHALVRWSSRSLGRSLSFFASDRLALVRRHARRVLGEGVPQRDVDAAGREMFASYGRYWGEVFWFRARRRRWAIRSTEIDGKDRVLDANAEGRGVVLAIAHLGNWEVAATVAESIGLPIVSVAEELPNPRLTDWFIDTRARFGVEILIAGRGSVMTALIRALKEGKTVALVADRDVTGRGIDVVFFGETTKMPTGPVTLAELTGAALFPVGTYFEGKGFRLVAHPELRLDRTIEDRDERIAEATQRLAATYEEIIRREPTQWHLFQPNWPSDLEWMEQRR
jgi:phosphatidylinositol dimannoside acyltransferase